LFPDPRLLEFIIERAEGDHQYPLESRAEGFVLSGAIGPRFYETFVPLMAFQLRGRPRSG
jgi:hypothetical protein